MHRVREIPGHGLGEKLDVDRSLALDQEGDGGLPVQAASKAIAREVGKANEMKASMARIFWALVLLMEKSFSKKTFASWFDLAFAKRTITPKYSASLPARPQVSVNFSI